MYDRSKLKDLPQTPGVYLMKNENKEIIYVGKAINLRNRVRQYFQSRHESNSKTAVLVSHIAEIETIVTDSEMEALILESNLIKQHRPRYNILLKDDKNYPWIRVTLNEDYPKIVMTRSYKKDGSRYFGPFTSAAAVKNTIEAVSRVYPLKTCNRFIQYGKKTGRPCLNYHIGQCQGPCQGKLPPEKYKENIDAILDILNGHYTELIDNLQGKMKSSAIAQDYENAAKYRDQIEGIKHIAQKQKITSGNQQDQDFINLALDGEQACFQVFHVREGKLLGRDPFFLSGIGDESEAEIVASFLKQYYVNCGFIPKEIIIKHEPESLEALLDWLSELAGRKITITIPQRGQKVKMLEMVQENAEIALKQRFLELAQRENRKMDRMQELAEFLKLSELPVRIEAYDISNIAGSSNVGGMVVFTDGKLDKKACRRFKIKSVDGQNDYASMQEMLFRRLERAQKGGENNGFLPLPQVMMMDGGQGHVNAAKAIISMYPFDIVVCGLVKDDQHRLRGVYKDNTELLVKKASTIGVFLNEISEEVHRYAIGYHKILRKKEMLASVLEEIPGVGEKRRKALMFHFGRLENIKKATLEELTGVSGMNQKLAQAVYDFFHRDA
ncbi:excinuclease ABC subunit UvrC [Eubacteriaceae bacterium ES3]|nr:excinuclease ABC subunit UvrC [Eubacteriaceae bacterium ES3]